MKMMVNNMQFDKCFETGDVSEFLPVTNTNRHAAAAACLNAWACCIAGTKPPEKFGDTIVALSDIIGITVTPNNMDELEEHLKRFPIGE